MTILKLIVWVEDLNFGKASTPLGGLVCGRRQGLHAAKHTMRSVGRGAQELRILAATSLESIKASVLDLDFRFRLWLDVVPIFRMGREDVWGNTSVRR